MYLRMLGTLAVLAVGHIITTVIAINTPLVSGLIAPEQLAGGDAEYARLMAVLAAIGWVSATLTVSGTLLIAAIWWGPVSRWMRINK